MRGARSAPYAFEVRRLVALALVPGPEFAEELRRCWEEGDAVLPLDTRLSCAALDRIVEAMRPDLVVESPGVSSRLDKAEPVAEGDALVVVTSGTTGEAKGVVLTHEAVRASALATSARLEVDPSRDRWLACLPFAHVGGLSVLTRAIVTGTPIEIQPRFSPALAIEAAIERGASLVSLVPTALWRLGSKGAAAFRTVVVGGQQPPADLPANAVTTYGMTETGSGVVYDGRPLDGVEVRLVAGEVFLRCAMLLRAYRDGSDPKTSDGWYPTGDAGELGTDGQLRIRGRLDDVVISGGENIWPAQVESVIRGHPVVSEVAVGGAPDPLWGMRVVAYVVARSGADPVEAAALLGELRELVSHTLAGFAAPRELVLVTALPRSAIGKVNRSALVGLDGPRALAG
jgi:O-succinylbenzoic acid--CoA ligase